MDLRLVDLTSDLKPSIKELASHFEDRYIDILSLLDQRLSLRGLDVPKKDLDDLIDFYLTGQIK
jgi:hypothetical protein